MPSKLREILRGMFWKYLGVKDGFTLDDTDELIVDQALSSLRELLKEEIGKDCAIDERGRVSNQEVFAKIDEVCK